MALFQTTYVLTDDLLTLHSGTPNSRFKFQCQNRDCKGDEMLL